MNKTEKYQLLYEQVKALLNKEKDEIANMANIAALIHETFNFWWTGFYIVKGEELVLGRSKGQSLVPGFRLERVYAEAHGRGRRALWCRSLRMA